MLDDHKIGLKVTDGSLNAAKGHDDILRNVLWPLLEARPRENFVLVDDNPTSHRASLAEDYKEANEMVAEDWPAQLPT